MKKCKCKNPQCDNLRNLTPIGNGFCRSCGQKVRKHLIDCNCCICKANRGEFNGPNHPSVGNTGKGPTSQVYNCIYCGIQISYQSALYGKGSCQTCRCLLANETRKLNGFAAGENHYNWKGGRTTLYDRIRVLDECKQWKLDIYKKAHFICQHCFATTSPLNAHHLIPFHVLLEEFCQFYNITNSQENIEYNVQLARNWEPFWTRENGIALCITCHRKAHSKKHDILIT